MRLGMLGRRLEHACRAMAIVAALMPGAGHHQISWGVEPVEPIHQIIA